MKSIIKELGNKIPVSKVICEFHLFPLPFLMSYGTEHLIIQSLGPAAPDNGTKQEESGAGGHRSCKPQWAPPLVGTEGGAAGPISGLCLAACHYSAA